MFSFFFFFIHIREKNNHDRVTKERKQDVKMTKKKSIEKKRRRLA
jgi:hypothetical protein